MSARHPFVPTRSRPASRAAHQNSPAPLQKSAFAPDRTDPLHSNADANGNTDSAPPLNLQNLMKKKSFVSGKNTISAPGRRASTSEHAIEKEKGPLPGFPRRVQTSTPNIVAPHPLPMSLPMFPLFAGADLAVKATDPSHPHTLQSPTEKDPHIPTSFAVPDVSFASPVKPNTKFQHKSQPHPGGPYRANENRSKRSRSELGEDDLMYAYDTGYGSGQNKRYKMDGPDKHPGSFSPDPLSSPMRHSEYRNSPTSSSRGHRQHPGNESFHDYETHTLSQGNNEGTLDKLLGRDANLFVEEHMDNYEVLMEKWKNCTIDEWVAGADVIMVKYSKILEFVKAHMTMKLKLFATFDKQVDSHGVVLEERQKVLAGVKQSLNPTFLPSRFHQWPGMPSEWHDQVAVSWADRLSPYKYLNSSLPPAHWALRPVNALSTHFGQRK
ncbi:uncharacterized protein BT62DRAFT_1077522 [Guyanagaster necrorhizus]|uniref:Uncharacterized protein n=1 Tax=Guyanagaster necrorhizus TaxID=856835 RepID=A0A9P8ASD5_9AGAR|nr:uncharacterized protein BT62DRAFT_1077522 [Guyanagaster necrorhizus MCA 3950]KAG7444757.1 hypothetical protein BT62DRAFT_1077522 [Guyanagaster necrorhizus MCA 3950]